MNQPIKYSDLLQPDNSIQQAIDQLEQLNKTYAQTLQTVKNEAIRLQASIEGVSGATEQHRTRIRNTASETDKLAEAQRKLEAALSENAVKLAELKEQQREAQNVAKLTAKLNLSEEGSYNALAAQYALNQIQLKKLSEEYKTNNAEGQKLVRQTEELYTRMKEVQSVMSQQAMEQQKAEQATREQIQEMEKLAKAQRELDYATSDTAKRIAELNLQKQEQQAINKLVAKLNSAEAGSYNALSAQYSLNKIQLNKLSQEYRENTEEGKRLVKETEEIYAKMKLLQEATGKYTLNVGNYKSAWDGLGVSAQQLVRELPSLAVSANTFFLAISNNIPMLVDEINKLKAANAAAAAAGEATVPIWKSVAKAFLSWNTVISLGITLLTVFGGDIIKWIQNLVVGEKRLDHMKAAMQGVNDAMQNGRKEAQQSIVRLNLLYNATQDVTKSVDERKKAVAELKKEFPTYFKNLSDEKILAGEAADEYNRLAKSITATAMARAAEEQMIENSKQILDLETEITKAYQEQEKAEKRLRKAEANIPDVIVGGEAGQEMMRHSLDAVRQAQNEIDKWGEAADNARTKLYALNKANTELAKRINIEDLTATPGKETKAPKDRTQTVTTKNINITESLYRSNTDLIADDLQRQRQLFIDTYNSEIADLMNKYNNDKDLTEQSRENINKIVLNKQKKLQQDLAALDIQQQQRDLETEKATIQLRLDAVEQGTEEENSLRIQLLENARKQELLANSQLIESQQQDEAAINAKYNHLILQQNQRYFTERMNAELDQAQKLKESRLYAEGATEQEITQFKLEAERERLQLLLDLVSKGAKKMSKVEIATVKNTIKGIDEELKKVQKNNKQYGNIYDILGESLKNAFPDAGWVDDAMQGVETYVGFTISQLQSLLQAQVQLKEQQVQNAQEEVEAAQNRLNQEIEARNNGYANDVITAQKELQLSRQKEQQALKQKQKAQRQEQALDTLTQTSSLITATANIWKSLSGIPIVGYALAMAAIATMWSSFAAAKIKARQLTQTQDVEYGQGGLEILQGGSHQSGNDVDLGTMPDGRRRRAEGGEAVAVINKRATRKYRKELPSIIKSINQGTYSNDTYNYDNRNDIIKYIDKRIVEQLYTNAYTIDGITLTQNQPINNIDDLKKNVKKIAENSETRYYTDGRDLVIRYKNLTKRIIKR